MLNVTDSEYGEAWPFTVKQGQLECINSAIIFRVGGKAYALNGTARMRKQNGRPIYADVQEIWREDPAIQGARVSIQPMIEKGLELL